MSLKMSGYTCDKCNKIIISIKAVVFNGWLEFLVKNYTVRIFCNKCGDIVKRAEHSINLEGDGRKGL